MNDFWSMGGYARFVWPCFGFAAIVVVWNIWAARNLLHDAKQRAGRALAAAASEVA